MTEEEFRQIMKAGGWSEEEINDHLEGFYERKKENPLLTLEWWIIPEKPRMRFLFENREKTDTPE